MSVTRATGVVKWFDFKKGWGFIRFEGKDYFCYFNEILGDGFKTLKAAEVVKFDACEQEKGLVAKNVVRS